MGYEDTFSAIKIRSGKIALVKSKLTIGLPGTVAEFTFPHDTMTNTEQAAALAKVYDLSAAEYQNLATSGTGAGYTANYQIFPDTEAIGDYAIFGAASPFGCLYFDISATAATYGADAITWQYWNGTAWSTLAITFDTTNTTPAADGKRPFMQDGYVIFSAPTDWKAVEIDGQSAYWIRAYVDAAQITQIPLTDSKEHYLVSSATASQCEASGTIGKGRLSFVTVSGSTADTDVILCNLTKGTSSAIKTLTKALKVNVVADFSLVVDADDYLSLFYTDEDGTTEFANGILEATLTRD